MEKIIDNNYYLDGGFYDNVPANALLNRGYTKVYAVDLKAIGIKRPYLDKKRVVEICNMHPKIAPAAAAMHPHTTIFKNKKRRMVVRPFVCDEQKSNIFFIRLYSFPCYFAYYSPGR